MVPDGWDALPRSKVRIGERIVSSWWLAALSGSMTGTAVLLALTPLAGLDPGVSAGLVGLGALVFVGWGLARSRLRGLEETVLLEHVFLVVAAWAALLWALEAPVLRYLDLAAVGLCVQLASGRIGCLVAGCCYGIPSSFGVRYPAECHPHAPGIRRFPVQAVEIAVWAALALLGAVHAPGGRPGAFLGGAAMAYGSVRFMLEGLRADPRPHLGGLSYGRWLSIAALCAGVALTGPPTARSLVGLGIAASAALVLWGTRSRWRMAETPEDAQRAALHALGHQARELAPEVGVHAVDLGQWRLALSRVPGGDGFAVSVSTPSGPLARAEAEWVLAQVAEGAGFHGSIDLVPRGAMFLWCPPLPAPEPASSAPPPSPGGYFQRPSP